VLAQCLGGSDATRLAENDHPQHCGERHARHQTQRLETGYLANVDARVDESGRVTCDHEVTVGARPTRTHPLSG
jgi:hypothetical protein